MSNEIDAVITVRARDLTKAGFAAASKAMRELEKQTEGQTQTAKGFSNELTAFFNKPVNMAAMATGAMAAVGARGWWLSAPA